MMDGWWDDGWWDVGWWMGMVELGMVLVLLFFLALAIGGVYLIARALRGEEQRSRYDGRDRTSPRSNALSILEERYARGEIDSEEFEERRRNLLSG